MKGTTTTMSISVRSISEAAQEPTIARLRDTKEPRLYFGFARGDRSAGSWMLVYYDKKIKQRVWSSFAKYPDLSPAQAKATVKRLWLDIAAKESREVIAAKAKSGELVLVSDLLTWFETNQSTLTDLSSSRKRAIKSAIHNHLIPGFTNYEITELDTMALERVFAGLKAKGLKLSTLRAYFGVLQKALAKASILKLIKSNPVYEITAAKLLEGVSQEKKCNLDPVQIEPLFRRLHLTKLETWGLISLQFLLLSRVDEIASAKWRHIDMESMIWTLYDTKNGSNHKVFINWVVVEVLSKLKAEQRAKGIRTDFIFPNNKNRSRCLGGDAAGKRVIRFSKSKWSSHDLRKYGRNWLTNNKIDHAIGEYLVNHKLSKTERAYISSVGRDSAYSAWLKWAEHLHEKGLLSRLKKYETGKR